jgi:hypothetical protein
MLGDMQGSCQVGHSQVQASLRVGVPDMGTLTAAANGSCIIPDTSSMPALHSIF